MASEERSDERVLAVERGEPPAGLGDDRHQGGDVVLLDAELGDELEAAFGQQHVRPGIAVAAVAPDRARQADDGIQLSDLIPLADALEAHAGVADRIDG